MKKSKVRNYVVDSFAVLNYLQKEKGWQETGLLLRSWKRKGIAAKLSWINWGEIYYIIAGRFGKEKAGEAMDLVEALPISLETVDFDLVKLAAELKSNHKISYADAFCAATALRYNAILVTSDPEFKALEDVLDIRWLG